MLAVSHLEPHFPQFRSSSFTILSTLASPQKKSPVSFEFSGLNQSCSGPDDLCGLGTCWESFKGSVGEPASHLYYVIHHPGRLRADKKNSRNMGGRARMRQEQLSSLMDKCNGKTAQKRWGWFQCRLGIMEPSISEAELIEWMLKLTPDSLPESKTMHLSGSRWCWF